MERVNKIINHPKYKKYLSKIEYHEQNREFCRHNMEHFMDVARICYIMCLEENLQVNKEVIYGVALLHDIGRWVQYEDSTPHEKASYDLSGEILRACNFNESEINTILQGILNHRNKNAESFNKKVYDADKLSRGCFLCKVEKQCNWAKEKKNLNIIY